MLLRKLIYQPPSRYFSTKFNRNCAKMQVHYDFRPKVHAITGKTYVSFVDTYFSKRTQKIGRYILCGSVTIFVLTLVKMSTEYFYIVPGPQKYFKEIISLMRGTEEMKNVLGTPIKTRVERALFANMHLNCSEYFRGTRQAFKFSFMVYGSKNNAIVYADYCQDDNFNFDCRFLMVELQNDRHNRFILCDNRAKYPEKEKVKEGMSQALSFL